MIKTRAKKLAAAPLLLLSSLAMLSPLATAEVFDIKYETTMSGSGSALPIYVVTEFSIDTDAAPVIVMPQFDWESPLYGYQRAAISGLRVTIGDLTLDENDLSARIPKGGYSADVWFNAPLSNGATPKTWMFLDKGPMIGSLQFGGGACGTPCYLYDTASFMAQDPSTPQMLDVRGPLVVTVRSAVSVGIPGPVGPQGPAGVTGPIGPVGPAGVAGPQGPIGVQGPIGLTGPVGPAGEKGEQGQTGTNGTDGTDGATGPQGSIGPQGPVGAVGPQGIPGEQGPSGPVHITRAEYDALFAEVQELRALLDSIPSGLVKAAKK